MFEIVEDVPAASVVEREQWWLAEFKPALNTGPAMPNPMFGRRHRPESIELMRQKLAGRPSPNKGRALSASHRAALSAVKKGVPRPRPAGWKMSDEARAKISTFRKGRPLSAETKARIGAAGRGKRKNWSPEERAARCERLRAMGRGKRPWNKGKALPRGADCPRSRAVILDGIRHPTIGAAALAAGVCVNTMRKRLARGLVSFA